MEPNVEDNAQTTVAVAASFILLIVAVVGLGALVSRGSTRQHNSHGRHRLNASVSVVPLPFSGAHMQRVNHPTHRSQLLHHLHPMDFVNSLRDPPPAYPVHHPDVLFDVVAHGNGNIGNPARGTVDVMPLPPPYPADPEGKNQPFCA